MATNNKTMQINTFGKGMNTDISDSLLDNESYRLAKNLRIVTDTEENSGELRLIEGAAEIKNLLLNKQPSDYEVIAATLIRNYGLIITKDLNSESPDVFNDDDTLYELFYKYFIDWEILLYLMIDPLTLENRYESTITFYPWGKIGLSQDDPDFSTSSGAKRGFYSSSHEPIITIYYTTRGDGELHSQQFNLNDGFEFIIGSGTEDILITSVDDIQISDDFEIPDHVVGYELLQKDGATLNVTTLDDQSIAPDLDMPDPEIDKSSVTIAWWVDNYKTNRDDDIYKPAIMEVGLVGKPSDHQLLQGQTLLDTLKTKQLARYMFDADGLYLAYRVDDLWKKDVIGVDSAGYMGLSRGHSLVSTTTTPLYTSEQSYYPKDVSLYVTPANSRPIAGQTSWVDSLYQLILNYREYDSEQNLYYYKYPEFDTKIYVKEFPVSYTVYLDSQSKKTRRKKKIDQKETDSAWSVWRFDNDTDELTRILTCYTPIGFNFENKPSLTTYWEDDDNIKLYIADGEHGILVVNVALPLGEYKGLTKLSTLSSVVPPPITDITKTDGLLAPAYVQYAYRMYNKHGIASKLSILSKLKSVDNASKGIPDGKLSNVGYSLVLPYNKTDFDRVLIYRISYRQLGQLPTIDLIIDEKYEWQHPYVDTGRTTLQTITIEEFNSLSGIEIVPREIESKDNFLFASNIKYRTSEYIDAIKEWKSEAMTSDMKSNLSDNDTWLFSAWGFGYDELDSNVTWKYVTDPSESKTLRRGEVYRYGIILYMDDGYVSSPKWIADIRMPIITAEVTQQIEQYQENDINDKASTLYNITHPYYSENGKNIIANNLGILFTINNLPEGCIGYEIVRCNRTIADRHTITLVVLSNTFRGNDDMRYVRMPTGLITTDKVIFYAKDTDYLVYNTETGGYYSDPYEHDDLDSVSLVLINQPDTYQAISPEIVYLPDDVLSIFDSYTDIQLLPVFRILPDESTLGFTPIDGVENAGIISLEADPRSMPYLLPDRGDSMLVIYGGRYWGDTDDDDSMKYFHGTLAKWYFEGLYDIGTLTDTDLILHNLRGIEHAYLYNVGSPYSGNYTKSTIGDYNFAKVDRWDEFADGTGNFKFTDSLILIDNESYINWVIPAYLLDYNTNREGRMSYLMRGLNSSPRSIVRCSRVDIGGRCAVITTSNTSIRNQWENNEFVIQSTINGPLSTFVCNITKHAIPYGGLQNINNSIYYSSGNYHSSDELTMDVYDGDTFIKVLEYTATHDWEHNQYKNHIGCTTIYHIPFETDIDIDKDHGDKYSRVLSLYIQDLPASIMDKYTQKNPEYAYNTAYSSQSQARLFSSSDDYYERMNDVYDYRVHYSNPKSTNELIDSYTVFQPLNYLDVDTRYGEITELRTFLNNLLYWLNNAVGLLSVNERVQLADESNLPLILGTGGVLARYDYLSTRNGMKENLFADTQSDTVLYWWDYDRHEICAYSGGTQVVPLSKSKFIQNMLNSASKKGELTLNPHLAFDKPYNEVLFTITDGYSVIYNEYLQYFSAIYDTTPFASLAFTDRIIFLPAYLLLYVWNKSNGLTSWSIEDERLLPYLKYVANDNSTYTKVYDNSEFGGRMYGGETYALLNLSFRFTTPLKQEGRLEGDLITNRQYEFEFAVPRSGELINMQIRIGGYGQFVTIESWKTSKYGDRLRGKTMQCEMSSTSNSLDFSLQYIITKYRISWS